MRTPSQTTDWNSEFVLPLFSNYICLTIYSPASPDQMDWSVLFSGYVAEGQDEVDEETLLDRDGEEETGEKKVVRPKKLTKDVEVADIGCGFGGLLMALAPALPDTLCLGW